MNKCTSWLGHKFSPRYNEESIISSLTNVVPPGMKFQAYVVDVLELTDKLKNKKITYVCDVCVRCGMIAKNE